jgi:hypothetical protein
MTAGYPDVAADKVTASSGASTTMRSRRIALCDRMVSSLGSPNMAPSKAGGYPEKSAMTCRGAEWCRLCPLGSGAPNRRCEQAAADDMSDPTSRFGHEEQTLIFGYRQPPAPRAQ